MKGLVGGPLLVGGLGPGPPGPPLKSGPDANAIQILRICGDIFLTALQFTLVKYMYMPLTSRHCYRQIKYMVCD